MHKSVQITLIVMAGILIFGLLIFLAIRSFVPSSNIVSGNGVASLDVMPDLIIIYFNVETKADTSQEASNENAEIGDNVKTAIIAEGFEEKEIETQSFSVYPNYEWRSNKNVQDGYIAQHSIRIKLEEDRFDAVGEVVDAGVNAGALVSYINFELSQGKENEYKIQAIKLASEDAKTKAEATASGLGEKLGRLVSVSSSDFYYYPWKAYTAAEGASGSDMVEAATDIQPSTQEVSASVTAVFRIR